MGKVTARTGPSHFKQLINMKKYTLIGAYDLCIVPTVPWLNTIWMRKANFESYIIPSESEYGDVRSREMGLPSWARKPILIGTHLNFWPHFFSPCWTTSSSSPQNSHTLFFRANYISTELYMDPCFYMLFFPHPQVLVLQGSELSRNFAKVKVTQCVVSRIFQNCGSSVSK